MMLCVVNLFHGFRRGMKSAFSPPGSFANFNHGSPLHGHFV